MPNPHDAPPGTPRNPLAAIKGRGAVSQLQHRFASDTREPLDDGWAPLQRQAWPQALPSDDDEIWWAGQPAWQTQVRSEQVRSAVQKNDSPDIYFDHSVNPYRGCEHGCIYCYARPYHSYLNLSPGLDFETRLVAKTNIAEVLAAEIAKPSYQPASLNIGSATDCYQPIEREWQLTRHIIEALNRAAHPFSLITKSSGVERDIDLIAAAALHKRAAVYITITSLDRRLARLLEPRAAAPHRRLQTIRTLVQAGIPVGVSVAPQIPFITEDMEQVLQAARDAGATSAFYTMLRLPWELNTLFQQWLQAHFPDRAVRIMQRIRDAHGISDIDRLHGKSYDSSFANRMKGQGLWADLIRQRFEKACRRLGLNRERTVLEWDGFESWRQSLRADSRQQSLF